MLSLCRCPVGRMLPPCLCPATAGILRSCWSCCFWTAAPPAGTVWTAGQLVAFSSPTNMPLEISLASHASSSRTCWYFLESLASWRLSAFFSSSLLVSASCISCTHMVGVNGACRVPAGSQRQGGGWAPNSWAPRQGHPLLHGAALLGKKCLAGCQAANRPSQQRQRLTCTVCFSVSLLGETPFFLNMRLDSECRPLARLSFRPDSTLTSPAGSGKGDSARLPQTTDALQCAERVPQRQEWRGLKQRCLACLQAPGYKHAAYLSAAPSPDDLQRRRWWRPTSPAHPANIEVARRMNNTA